MALDDIVGYSYRADTYGPECIMATVNGLTVDHAAETAERDLDVLAQEIGIDRQDERSFDSWDFPKVIFRDQLPAEEHCGSCGEMLG